MIPAAVKCFSSVEAGVIVISTSVIPYRSRQFKSGAGQISRCKNKEIPDHKIC